MTNRDQQIDDMLSREAIRDLPVRYCHYVREKNIGGVVDLFTDDGVFDVGVGDGEMITSGARAGKETLRKFYSEGIDRVQPWPFVHNHVVDLLGPDRAKGWVYMEMRGGPKLRTAQIVVYEDDYAREGGRWKFKKRTIAMTPIPE